MDLTSPTKIKETLARHGIKPSKGLGQNFLIDKNVLDKIIAAADLKSSDTVLEVGPGIGTLTQELAQKAKQVTAIEKDATICKILEETLKDFKNIEVISADILKINLKSYAPNSYKVVANIPYYLTSPLIRKFLESGDSPQEMVLMLQKEVAQRICAQPPDMSLLSVSVQFYADPKITSYVSKNCFWPSPKVDSAIIKIVPHKKYNIPVDLFFKVVKAGFSQPRKQLLGNLIKTLKIEKEKINKALKNINVNPKRRAETLSLNEWKTLAEALAK